MCTDRKLTDAEAKIAGHNVRCERARTPRKDCRCSCGGAHHGISVRLDDIW